MADITARPVSYYMSTKQHKGVSFFCVFRAGPYGLETVYNTFGLASGQVFVHHLLLGTSSFLIWL